MAFEKRPTITDVARAAGVSITTVSKVINNTDEHIRSETREKVHQAIIDLGYIPTTLSKGLKIKYTKTIGFIIPDIGIPFFHSIAGGAGDTASKSGYSVIYSNTDGNDFQEKRCIEMFRTKMVDGFIYISSHNEENEQLIRSCNKPTVVLDRNFLTENDRHMGSILINNYHAACDATELLVQRGCRRPAYVASSIAYSPGKDRFQGFVDTLKSHGIDFVKSRLYVGNFSAETGFSAAMNLMEQDRDIDSFFCENDLEAFGVLNALQRLGFSVPGQIKVMGFDDIYISKFFNPELSTVRQPTRLIGSYAAKMLIDFLEKGDPLGHIIMPHEVIIRKTV